MPWGKNNFKNSLPVYRTHRGDGWKEVSPLSWAGYKYDTSASNSGFWFDRLMEIANTGLMRSDMFLRLI